MATLFLFEDKDMVALPIFVSANMATLSLFGDTTIAALSLFGDMTDVTGVPFIAAFYTRWSGDVIWGTGKKNFNAVSHNRARP